MTVSRVQIVDVRVEDTWVFAKCETIETSGLNSGGVSWDIEADTSNLFLTNTFWEASWQIFFNPTVILRVQEIVATLPPGKTYADDYTSRPAPGNSRFVSIRTPGPCASELFSFLYKQQLSNY